MWNCPPRTILVPVDFGDASARAVAVAAALAARTGARLRVLHAEAIDAPPYFTHDQLATIERERKAARAQAQRFLADFAERHGAPPCETVIAEGSPRASIVDAARTVDLVVMGTQGRSAPSRWWMGSVAEHVVHASATPVLVVRADLGGVAPEHLFDHPLVVSLAGDGSAASRVASGLAQAFGGHVADTVVACRPDLARERNASLIAVSKASGDRTPFDPHVEQWLRSCTLPMVFVPA